MADLSGATSSQTSTADVSAQGGVGGTHRIIDKVRDTATAQLTSQKNRATDGLGSLSQAVRQSTHQLRDQEHDVIAHYIEQAADQIDRFSQRMRDKDVADLVRDVQHVARRQPALFIGGAFAIGLIGARFFKSSSRTNGSGRADGDALGGARDASMGSTGAGRGFDSNLDADSGMTPGAADAGTLSDMPTSATRPSTGRSRRSGPSERL
jgi:hypothetical protein